jgi:[NiFe] hydrogenase diaphorase moiety large subunit
MVEPIEPARTGLLNKLWDIQLKDGYISDEKIAKLAAELDISMVEVEGVASFYHFFHRQPTGKFTIYLNTSMTSEMAVLQRIREAFERETGTTTGSVDRKGIFGLFETPCIGLSDQEPSVLINFPHIRIIASTSLFDVPLPIA